MVFLEQQGAVTTNTGSNKIITTFPFNFHGRILGSVTNYIIGGTGSGSGARSGTGNSGAGGSGAGVLILNAKYLFGSGNITCIGGNGSNATGTGPNGGGASGGGGVIIINSSTDISSTNLTLSVNGGTAVELVLEVEILGGSGNTGTIVTNIYPS